MKDFIKSICSGVSLILFSFLLMTGCTGPGSGRNAADTKKILDYPRNSSGVKRTALRIATMFGGTDPAAAVYEEAILNFQDANPSIEITDESMTSEGDGYRTKIKTDFSSGNDLDVVFFYTGADARYIIQAGKLMPYEEMWKDYPDLARDITDFSREAMREFDGKIYALPVTGFYEGLFLNQELFQKYQVELPTDWNKFENAIQKFHQAGIVPIAGPLAQSHYLIEHFILSAAGAKGHQDVFADGINSDWILGFQNLRKVYDMGGFSKDAATTDIEMAQDLFRKEKAAMILEGSWLIGGCSEKLQKKMTVLPMPPAPNGKMEPDTLVAGLSSGYSVSTKAWQDPVKRKAAVKLVNTLLGSEVVLKMAAANGGVPAAGVSVSGLSPVAKDGYVMFSRAKHRNMPIDSRLVPEAFNEIVKYGVPYIVTGEKTPEDVLEQVRKIQNLRDGSGQETEEKRY
jgi:raffinose/stachyose/melibiose transport system substrate-binding protein